MPRQPRLDAQGLLQHVMARGIERRDIFKDNKDRKAFLDRLAIILEETQTQCYAWALIPNHFHLLLRTGPTPLSKVMRRLMTGYAVTFNKRHKRTGHLFQNRYKSIVCEEDSYLLELIRYIHLNPLRAGLVKNLKDLDKYLWAGHSTILGNRKNPLIPEAFKRKSFSAERRIAFTQLRPGIEKAKTNHENPVDPVQNKKVLSEKTVEDVLLHFGDTVKVSRRRYRQFIKGGVDQGTRPELQGGGLVRSAGGKKAGLLGRKKEEREKGDERILGSGDFVSNVLEELDEFGDKRKEYSLTLDELIDRIARRFNIDKAHITSTMRQRKISMARCLISFFALYAMQCSGASVSKALNVSRAAVSKSSQRGKRMVDSDEDLWHLLE